MPMKMARSGPQPPHGPSGVLVAVHTSRPYCEKAGKATEFASVRGSSGESRLNGNCLQFLVSNLDIMAFADLIALDDVIVGDLLASLLIDPL